MIRVLKITALVSVVVLLNAVTTLLFVQNAAPASAGPNCVNGDVNGDAALDITDPIYLLTHMFDGGPEPIACAQSPGAITASEMESVLNKFHPRADDYFKLSFIEGPNLPQNVVRTFIVPFDKSMVIAAIDEIGPVSVDLLDPVTGLDVEPTGFLIAVGGNVSINTPQSPRGTAYVCPPGTEVRVTISAGSSFSSGALLYGHFLNAS